MSILAYPKFLNRSDVPLMQPAIAHVLREVQLPDLIAEYACPADQVETRGMIAFFEKEIPPECMQAFKSRFPEATPVLDENPCETVLRGSIAIKNSTVRKLITLAKIYFAYRVRVYKLGLPDPSTLAGHNYELYDFFGRIPGCTIIQRCDPEKDLRLCHAFIFGHLEWYKKIKPDTKLITELKRVLDFLRSKGFEKNTVPSVGQIVVYHTATTTKHFARVVRIEDNKVIAVSKFGSSHVFEHSIGSVPVLYGNSVTFLNPPK